MNIDKCFKEYLEEAIGAEKAAVAFSAFDEPASVSVRLNPSKLSSATHFGCGLEEVPWSRYGFLLDRRPVFTLDPLLHCGAYYVQDSSSMFVGEMFRRVAAGRFSGLGRPLRVLDLCAAPGGKTTDLAASLRLLCDDSFILVSNEVMKARAGVLADNVALWGDPNVVVTNADPAAFARLKGCFDIIVADMPCSGEGMFRKDEQAVAQWSKDNVDLCSSRQRRIVADIWPALCGDGVLIYSTCTFNRYENDMNISWISENFDSVPLMTDLDFPGVIKTDCGYALVPGFVPGEGQYCAAVLKNGETDVLRMKRNSSVGRKQKGAYKGIENLFSVPVSIRQAGNLEVVCPEVIADEIDFVSEAVRPIRTGCAVGEMKGKDLVPSADMAFTAILDGEAFPAAELDLKTALAFLHRDTIVLPDAPKGYLRVCYNGLSLGFVKNLGSRCNNLHPQNRRIRMSIQ